MQKSDSSDLHDTAFQRMVRQEELILDVTNKLTEALEEAGVTKSELAKRIERSPGLISQVFGGGRNLTLRTISDIAAALSLRPTLQLSPDTKSVREVEARWQQHFFWRIPPVRPKIDLSAISQPVAEPAVQVA
jgi:transcriptional regulator with XRE-family HTH domain